MRVRRPGVIQPYAVLNQLSLDQYRNVPLKFGLSEYAGYRPPVNRVLLGPTFLYFGFIPAEKARNRNQQGLQVSGRNIQFHNCDYNPNSYIALFPDVANKTPTGYLRSYNYQFCTNVFSAPEPNTFGNEMDVKYFMFLETHWGGCGCYTQTDGTRTISVNQVISAAIGFR